MEGPVQIPFQGEGVDILEALGGRSHGMLFENNDVHDRRWVAVVVDPRAILTVHNGRTSLTDLQGTSQEMEDPFDAIRTMLPTGPCHDSGNGPPGPGGLFGYLGYDIRCSVETVPDDNPPDSLLPDAFLGVYDIVVSKWEDEDHVTVLGHSRSGPAPCDLRRRMDGIRDQVRGWEIPIREPGIPSQTVAVSNHRGSDYLDLVERIREYIRSGDVYQVNLTQRFLVPCSENDLAVYRRIRSQHPARHSALLCLDGASVLSFSPETFLKVEGDLVESRPIKGTIGRSADPHEDAVLAEKLRHSEKDRAELAMIVDLVRNDLARVCRAGTVAVHDHAHIESAPTVHHLVTSVTGQLQDGRDVGDLLRAVMPGGSITGAPKVRAMEIIDELENVRRGVYTGAIGFIGAGGRTELNVAIRTMVLEGGFARIHGGGGIVVDSVAECEYEESVVKVRGLLDALGAEIVE